MPLTDAQLAYLYALELSPTSQRWYEQKLTEFIGWCAQHHITTLDALTQDTLTRFLRHLRDTPSDRHGTPRTGQTIHGYARILRAFVRYCMARRWLPPDFLAGWKMPKQERKVKPTLPPDAIERLFAAARNNPHFPHLIARDTAILALLVDTGMRAAELCTLTLDRTQFRPNGASLIVWGKGSKQRELALGKRSRVLLHDYLTQHRDLLASKAPEAAGDWVFLRDDGLPLVPEGLWRLLRRLGDRAALEGVKLGPHVFRHSYALAYLRFPGNDIYKLSHLLGHTSLAVTAEYLKEYTSRDAAKGPSILDNLGK